MSECAVITGGTGLIGRQLVGDFVAAGWKVVSISRDPGRAAALAKDFGDRVLSLPIDLAEVGAAEEVVSKLAAHRVAPTVLVNNARAIDSLEVGVSGVTDRGQFLQEFTLQVIAAYELATRCVESMSGLRSIINISSIYGSVPFNPRLYADPDTGAPGPVSPIQYSVSKAALDHLTRELAIRFAPQVLVNGVAFGGVYRDGDAEFERRYARFCPQQRMLRVEEVSPPVLSLASRAFSGMTGQILRYDGGWTVW